MLPAYLIQFKRGMQIINVSIINVYCYSWCVVPSTNHPKGANTHAHALHKCIVSVTLCANDALWFEPARHLNVRKHRHPSQSQSACQPAVHEAFYLPFIWRIENHYVVCATYTIQHARQHCKICIGDKIFSIQLFRNHPHRSCIPPAH